LENKITYELAIVVPCFNEEKKLCIDDYNSFLKDHPHCFICFVNDGSTDETDAILKKLSAEFKRNTHVLTLTKNLGKGNAVRKGVEYILQNKSTKSIGYLDADLATHFHELLRLQNILKSRNDIELVFGSRILTLGNTIHRKRYRHLIGRVIATCISWILNAKIYDTQCGAKVMTKECATHVFKKPFLSKWLFDVELLKRLQHHHGNLTKTLEEPLKYWEDKGKSSVSWSYGLFVWWDLFRIKINY
jgi:dolichyl-phosphate beta-glucosyltransferase